MRIITVIVRFIYRDSNPDFSNWPDNRMGKAIKDLLENDNHGLTEFRSSQVHIISVATVPGESGEDDMPNNLPPLDKLY